MKGKQKKQKRIEKKMIGKRKRLEGEVVSTKNEKTVVVKVVNATAHPLYKKTIKRAKKYKAHTGEKVELGERVKIEQCRPISKEKRWKVIEVIRDDNK